MKSISKIIASFVIAAITTFSITTSKAQEPFKIRYAIGVNYTAEWSILSDWSKNHGDFFPMMGISGDIQLSKHHGVEAGIFYWQHKFEGEYYLSYPIFETRTFTVQEKNLSFRLGYKFYSKIINFGAGINFDRNMKNEGDGRIKYGVYVNIGKDIRILNELFIEPSIRFSYVHVTNDHTYGLTDNIGNLGMNLKLKYRF